MSSDKQRTQASYASGTGTTPLLGCSIGGALDATARGYPDFLALVSRHQKHRFTFAELHAAVEQFARGLIYLGVQKGDRVGIYATNCSECVITQFATAKLGAILVNVNPAYWAYELQFALAQSECQTLITVPDFNDANFISIFFETCPEARESTPGALSSHGLPFLKNLILIDENHPESFFGWNQVLTMGITLPSRTYGVETQGYPSMILSTFNTLPERRAGPRELS
jgi:fatty-acyl-CoA synthase